MCPKILKRHFKYNALFYIKKKNNVASQNFVDANLDGDLDSGKNALVMSFTVDDTAISWMSRFEKYMSLSTTEVEYVVVSEFSEGNT